MEICRGMYGLPQSGILANKLVKELLIKRWYYELLHTPGLFKDEACPIWFTLVVDDFGIKYIKKEHIDHLLDVLKQHYEVKKIGIENYFVASPSSGTTKNAICGYLNAKLRDQTPSQIWSQSTKMPSSMPIWTKSSQIW